MQKYVLEAKIKIDCKFLKEKQSRKSIFCKWCEKQIEFDQEIKNHLGILIPLEPNSDKIHECEFRGWSKTVPCRFCKQRLRFNNSLRGNNGNKIPFNINHSRHLCKPIKRNQETKHD